MKVIGPWQGVFSALIILLSAISQAQSADLIPTGHQGAPAQIVQSVDESRLISLPGSSVARFRSDQDQGAVAADMVLEHIQLTLKRSPEQDSALQGLIHSQQDPRSSLYHHWLTPQEFGEQFGPAQSDIDKITAWLRSKGIATITVAKGRSSIGFSATHRQIQNAFHTELHWFGTKEGREYSSVSNARVPVALAPVLAAVTLSNHVSKPQSHVVRQLSKTGGFAENRPAYVSNGSNYLAPGDFWTIYNATPAETSGITGKGVTIGIAGRSDVAASDVAAFRSAYLGNTYSGTYQQLINGPDPGTPTLFGDDVENALDVEWASALAPDAKIILVSSMTNGADGVYLSAQYLVDNNLADIISVSYSACESFEWGWLINYSNLWEQAAAQGITVAVASGDNGSAGCDNDQSSAAQYGLQVNSLASSAYNVAVGGTEFVDQSNSWGSVIGSTPLPGTSAQGYIPEKIWNESQEYSTLYAGSGGASNCYFSLLQDGHDTTACAGGWPKPDWQSGVTGIPADGVRDLPDVSFTAAAHDGYLITLRGIQYVVGGTSAGTPAFAGVMALLNQKAGGRQGLANYQLYALAGRQFGAQGAENQSKLQSCNASLSQGLDNSCVFYDVTSGSNAVPCVGGTQDCSATNSGDKGVLTGYDAGSGYDLASGLGSINISNLVNSWSVPSNGNSPTSTSLQISPTYGITHGSPVSVKITVAPISGSGTPTGSALLLANGSGVATAQLSNGSWTGNISALPGGDYQVTAQYSGDATYAASASSQVHVDVTPEASTTTVSVAARDTQFGNALPLTSIPYGSNVILTATVKGQSGIGTPTSSVSFSVGGKQFLTLAAVGGRAAYTMTTLAPGPYSATATYIGGLSFAQSTSTTPAQFTIIQANTTVTLSAGTPANGVTPVTAIVSAATFGNAPGGNVAFFVNGTQVGTAVVRPDIAATPYWAGTTFNIPTALLKEGSNIITAQYLGDANYAQSAVSAPVTIVPNKLTVSEPNPPAAPSLAKEFKTGAQISLKAIILGSFQNLQVQWAPGVNPTSGWSNSGITLSSNLEQPVLNVPIATWDTSSIATAGYYTLNVAVTDGGITTTATTFVYLEPDLLSSNWPLWVPDATTSNVIPVPVTDSSGNTNLVFGTFGNGAELFKTSIDGATQTSYPLTLGSRYEPAAGNLHFGSSDDLIYPDNNSIVVLRPDGTKDILAPPSSLSGKTFDFRNAQVVVNDVDGDSIPEVVAVGLGPGPSPWTTTAYLFAWRNNGEQLNSNFPISIPDWDGNLVFDPARVLVGDVDGDGKKEFVVIEGTTGTSFTPRLFAADGTPKPWNAATVQQPYVQQMALADLDHNGKLETIIEAGAPMGSSDSQLHVLNPDGSERQGWPQSIIYSGADSIAVGDLNRDGNEEIVLSHGGALSVYKGDGTAFWPNWTNPYGGFGPAVLADVNGDGYSEIVAAFEHLSQDPQFPTYNVAQLLVLDRNGTTIRSWNLGGTNGQQVLGAGTTVGDFLGDGKSEIAAGFALVGLGPSQMTQMGAEVLSTGWTYNPSASDWPMVHRDARQSAVLRRVSPTAVTLSSSANPSTGALPATFSIAVAPSTGGTGVPSGTVNLIDGDKNIGSCILSSGRCSITPVLFGGTHTLIAGYVGDHNYDVSYSPSITQSVVCVPTTTTLTITPSGGSLAAGSTYMLTATVTPVSGTATPTGNVVFTIGSDTQTVALNTLGVATFTGTAPTSAGSLSLSAAYQGSIDFFGSTSNILTEDIVINPVPSIGSMSPAFVSAATAGFTLTINGTGFVTGSTVYWGNAALTTEFVSSSQIKAEVPASNIARAGVTAITVQNPAPGGGTSNALQFEIDSAGSGSTSPVFTTTTATVSAGSSATYPVSLPASVSVSSIACLNLPAGATCSYSASSGTVSIATSTATPIGTYQVTVIFSEILPGPASGAFVLLPILLFPLWRFRRKVGTAGRWVLPCIAIALLTVAAMITACGGGSSPSQSNPSSPSNPTHQATSSGIVSLTVK